MRCMELLLCGMNEGVISDAKRMTNLYFVFDTHLHWRLTYVNIYIKLSNVLINSKSNSNHLFQLHH